jgi:histidinol-phosphate aminotransferase
MKTPTSLIRPLVRNLHGYVPGEQPKIKGLIKLNTNENPYPPSPKVLKAVKEAVDGRFRLYPNPTAQIVRERLAKLHRCGPENIIVGNGSDELLALAIRGFVEPAADGVRGKQSKATVQYFTPSYSLYPVLAAIHGAKTNGVPLAKDFAIATVATLKREKKWDFRAGVSLVTTPNAPSGRGYTTKELDALCRAHEGVLILDEAYVDFARENAMALALKYPHVIVSRTFSKAYSLCYQRVGYFVAHPELVEALDKIRDSYNVNGLGQIAAAATLDDLKYYRANFKKVVQTRQMLSTALEKLGFFVYPSDANFIFARPVKFSAEEWLLKLRDHKILVRWFKYPETRDFIRITIGTDAEAEALIAAAKKILA